MSVSPTKMPQRMSTSPARSRSPEKFKIVKSNLNNLSPIKNQEISEDFVTF